MKKNYLIKNYFLGVVLLNAFFISNFQAQVTQTFSFTGAMQSFTVPPCVSTITLDVRGAQGGPNPVGILGGLGGSAIGVLNVSQGNVLNIFVGGINGYNGGGAAGTSACTTAIGGVGGGASDIRLNGIGLNNRVIVAAGGGGAGGDRISACGRGTGGGGGGGLYGGGGGSGYPAASGVVPTGGTQTTGGIGGTSSFSPGQNGANGTLGFGGNGGTETSSNQAGSNSAFPGGVGGGATGGSGQQPGTNVFTGQSGAGGSSFLGTLTGASTSSGVRSGNGIVTISYVFQGILTSVVASPSLICQGSGSTLTASGQVSYTWSPILSNAGSIVVTPTVNTTYTLQGTNSLGCVSTTVIAVNINTAAPSLSVTNTASVLCFGKPFTATASGANTYTWTGGPNNGIAFVPTATSDYTVTGENGCGTSTAAITVTVNPLPNITASISSPTVCNGSSVTLNGGGSVSGYTWTSGAPNNTAFVPPASTQYTVTGSAANGCTATAIAGVTVLVTPNVPPVVTPTSVCLGTNATLTAVGATGYTWTPGTALNSFSAVVSPPGTTTYTLFRSNGACTSTANITLVISPLPFANATASPSLICAGDPVALNVFGGITYTWLPNGFTASNFTLYPNNSVSYTVTSSNGSCTASGAVQVSVNPSPVVGISTSTSAVCAGGNVTLTATGNAATYTWLPGPGNGTTYVVNPTVVSQYTLLGSNNVNCISQQTQLILTNLVPPLVLNSSVPFVCTGTTAVLSIANATVPGVTYSWSSNSGSGSTSNVTPTVTTTYFASAVTNSTGCSSTGSLALTVNISTFVVSSPTAICRGSSAVFVASGAANSYNWNVAGGNNTPSITVSPTLTSNYSVTGITGNCSSTLSVPLIVNLLPNVQASAAKSTICRLESGTLTATGATSYSWSNGATTPAISYNTLTITTTYTVTGTDQNNCVKSNTVTQFVATCPGIDNFSNAQNTRMLVYPNPNNGSFTIISDTDLKIRIVNTLGLTVFAGEVLMARENDIVVPELAAGMYFIVIDGSSSGQSKRIVVER